MRKKLSIISNITFIFAIILAMYSLINIYIVRKNLPEGVCPIDNNRPVMYAAIGLSLISLVFSFVGDKINKNEK